MPPQPDASSTKTKVAIDGKNLIIVSRGARQDGRDGNAGGTSHKNAPTSCKKIFSCASPTLLISSNGSPGLEQPNSRRGQTLSVLLILATITCPPNISRCMRCLGTIVGSPVKSVPPNLRDTVIEVEMKRLSPFWCPKQGNPQQCLQTRVPGACVRLIGRQRGGDG